MAALIRFVFSFGGLLLSLAAAALWLGVRPASRAGRRFLLLVTAVYTLGSIYVIPYTVSRLLVVGYHQVSAHDVPPGRLAIILLNSNADFVEDWSGRRFSYLSRVDAARLWEAYRVYRLAPDAWVICSEGVSRVRPGADPSAAVKREALVHLGVPASRILVDTGAYTTHDEAVHIAPVVRSLKVDRVMLVTSDTHMRRSLATFRAQGIDAIPAIARDPELWAPWPDWIVPNARALELTHECIHEVIGMVLYGVKGWLRF